MARQTLTRWKQLGVFLSDGGHVELANPFETIGADDHQAFRAAILRLVLAPRNNPRLSEDADDERSLTSDFTLAAAWILGQDNSTFEPSWQGVQRLLDAQQVVPRPFQDRSTNDTRWHGFVDWARFLGLGWSAPKHSLVPDPAFAVSLLLDDVFGEVNELTEAQFFPRLANALPIVDGGEYRTLVEERTERPWRRFEEHEVSPSLSTALLHLRNAGAIRLETRADARQRALLGGGGRILLPVSHILRAEGG